MTQAQAKRANQTLKGMVISVLLTLAVVIPVMFLNPFNQENNFDPNVDVDAVAAQAEQAASFTPVVAEVPPEWTANFARWKSGTSDGVSYWEVGYLTTDEGFVWIKQTDAANPTWISQHADSAPVTGSRSIGGVDWEERETLDEDGVRSVTLVGEVAGTTVLLNSDSGSEDLKTAAEAVIAAA
nr:DUF4245 domain-containing protein [Zhihengliuella flava]